MIASNELHEKFLGPQEEACTGGTSPRSANAHTHIYINTYTLTSILKQTDRQTDTLPCSQTDRHTHTHTDDKNAFQ